eukprot:scaffold102588_cov19-Tisochrysis_lutea.AAC.4
MMGGVRTANVLVSLLAPAQGGPHHGRSCSGGGSDDSNAKDGEDAGGAGQPSLSMHGNKGRGKAVCAKLEGAQAVGNGWDGERAEHWASDGGSSYKYRSRGGLRLDDEVNWRGEGMKLGVVVTRQVQEGGDKRIENGAYT